MVLSCGGQRQGAAALHERDQRLQEHQAWRWLLALAGRDLGATGSIPTMGTRELGDLFRDPAGADGAAGRLLELYLPLCRGCPQRFVVAHLAQSLDGRIAAANGASRWVTGPDDVVHNHRMRALFDAVVVGAGTVEKDDPQLTVRAVPGTNPVRVILDPRRRLEPRYRVFTDGVAPTILVCSRTSAANGARCGQAEVVGATVRNGHLVPGAVLDALAARGLNRVFIEGGGITVSRFLAAGRLHRLQIAIAPLIIGSGRPSITLPEIERLSAGLRPPTRRFELGGDILFECRLDG